MFVVSLHEGMMMTLRIGQRGQKETESLAMHAYSFAMKYEESALSRLTNTAKCTTDNVKLMA